MTLRDRWAAAKARAEQHRGAATESIRLVGAKFDQEVHGGPRAWAKLTEDQRRLCSQEYTDRAVRLILRPWLPIIGACAWLAVAYAPARPLLLIAPLVAMFSIAADAQRAKEALAKQLADPGSRQP